MTRLEHYLSHLQRFGIRPGLERVRAILSRLEDPQNSYPIVLVGGTNGKGSTCEFLARRLASEGQRVGLFTSPHLYRWNERVRVLDSKSLVSHELFTGTITDDEFDALFDQMQPHLDEIARDASLGQPTEFETLTALGLNYFAHRKVDIAVVEVGLGGRWDATNVVSPLVSVVTHVALDHCDRLGNTHAEIARDKVEIARPDRIFVTAETRADVLPIFHSYCDQIGAKLWSFQAIEYSNDRARLENVVNLLPDAQDETTPDFQILNAQTALVARVALSQSDARFSRPAIELAQNVVSMTVAGRFQIVAHDPTIVLDGANNPDGAAQLARQLERWLTQHPGSRLILVLGILADKDYRAMIAHLAPLAARVVATQSNSPRACAASEVAREAEAFCEHVETVVPVRAALGAARQSSTRNDIVCVTGSFYTISET
ncbi:MAG TPA: cyanophycin synthetase [Abditibacteriaceae bacterium]|jgi:dihydrofolate synthase/folylpolyglutamate synthase|nr:cyanophycin synthetase [Abditibacteriaceae bacterium]